MSAQEKTLKNLTFELLSHLNSAYRAFIEKISYSKVYSKEIGSPYLQRVLSMYNQNGKLIDIIAVTKEGEEMRINNCLTLDDKIKLEVVSAINEKGRDATKEFVQDTNGVIVAPLIYLLDAAKRELDGENYSIDKLRSTFNDKVAHANFLFPNIAEGWFSIARENKKLLFDYAEGLSPEGGAGNSYKSNALKWLAIGAGALVPLAAFACITGSKGAKGEELYELTLKEFNNIKKIVGDFSGQTAHDGILYYIEGGNLIEHGAGADGKFLTDDDEIRRISSVDGGKLYVGNKYVLVKSPFYMESMLMSKSSGLYTASPHNYEALAGDYVVDSISNDGLHVKDLSLNHIVVDLPNWPKFKLSEKHFAYISAPNKISIVDLISKFENNITYQGSSAPELFLSDEFLIFGNDGNYKVYDIAEKNTQNINYKVLAVDGEYAIVKDKDSPGPLMNMFYLYNLKNKQIERAIQAGYDTKFMNFDGRLLSWDTDDSLSFVDLNENGRKNRQDFLQYMPKIHIMNGDITPTSPFGDGDEDITNNFDSWLYGKFSSQPMVHAHKSEYEDFDVYQYWFYYPYNMWLGDDHHEHDWEGVFVWVDKNGDPFHITTTQHLWVRNKEVKSASDLEVYIRPWSHGITHEEKDRIDPLLPGNYFQTIQKDNFLILPLMTSEPSPDCMDGDRFKTSQIVSDLNIIKAIPPWKNNKLKDPEKYIRQSFISNLGSDIMSFIAVGLNSPAEIYLEINGQKTGIVDGKIVNEIDGAVYHEGLEGVFLREPSGTPSARVLAKENAEIGIEFAWNDNGVQKYLDERYDMKKGDRLYFHPDGAIIKVDITPAKMDEQNAPITSQPGNTNSGPTNKGNTPPHSEKSESTSEESNQINPFFAAGIGIVAGLSAVAAGLSAVLLRKSKKKKKWEGKKIVTPMDPQTAWVADMPQPQQYNSVVMYRYNVDLLYDSGRWVPEIPGKIYFIDTVNSTALIDTPIAYPNRRALSQQIVVYPQNQLPFLNRRTFNYY